MPVLSLSNITKTYIVEPILTNATFMVEDHDKIGFIGNNGAGKTTLFKIIAGELCKDEGEIYQKKDIKIGYLKQQLRLEEEGKIYQQCLSIFEPLMDMERQMRELEVAMSSHSGSELEELMERYAKLQERFTQQEGYSFHSKIRGTLIGLGFTEEDFEREISTLSGGQKSRLALAKMLLEEPDILLLDEPTNHLDIAAITWLEKFLKDFKGAVILISHDRYFLNHIVNKVVLLERGVTTTFQGNYDAYRKERKKQLELLRKQYEDQQKEIKRQEQIIERYLGLGRDRFIRQGKSRQKLLDKMKKLDPPGEYKTSTIRFTPAIESGKEVLRVEELAKSFSQERIFQHLNAMVYKGDKIGLIGPNGVGKSTFFRIIMKQLFPDEGEIKYGSNVHIAYFDQEMKNLSQDNTVIDEIWDAYPKLTHYEIRSYLAQFLFFGDDVFKTVDELSGGERGRLSLLKIMLSKANFLLLDEPTNHLDIDSKETLEDALNLYEGTVLTISHDRYFLNATSEKIFAMSAEGIEEYLGNYDYYLEKTATKEEPEEVYISKTERAQQKKEHRQQQQQRKQQRQQLLELENSIARWEEELSTIDEQLTNPALSTDYEEMLHLSRCREEVEKQLNNAYEDWIILQEEE